MSALQLGLFAWGNRRGLPRLLGLAVASALVLPLTLALFWLAAVRGWAGAGGPLSAVVVGRPMATWVVTQPFGCTGFGLEPARGGCAHFHAGIDLAAPAGTAVAAALSGLAEVIPGGGYGLHVVVHHGQGLDTLYAHLEDVAVATGEMVPVGGTLGHEGSTGLSTGPHLHFEVREAGAAVDPINRFPGIFGPEGQPQ